MLILVLNVSVAGVVVVIGVLYPKLNELGVVIVDVAVAIGVLDPKVNVDVVLGMPKPVSI